MARTTISIPDDLRARMDRADGVNWSALAARAFEQKLGELAKARREKDLSDVIQRLRSQDMDDREQDYRNGFRKGEEWAKNAANLSELRRLWAFYERKGPDLWDEYFSSKDISARARAEAVVWEIQGQDDAGWMGFGFTIDGRNDFLDFWKTHVGPVPDSAGETLDKVSLDDHEKNWPYSSELARGFADGALHIWRQIRPHFPDGD